MDAAGIWSPRSGDWAGTRAIGVRAVAMVFVGDMSPMGDTVAARAVAAAEPTSHWITSRARSVHAKHPRGTHATQLQDPAHWIWAQDPKPKVRPKMTSKF